MYRTKVGHVECKIVGDEIYVPKNEFDKYYKNLINWCKLEYYKLEGVYYYDITYIVKMHEDIIEKF